MAAATVSDERKNPYRTVWKGFGIGSVVLLLVWGIPAGITAGMGHPMIAKAVATGGTLIHLYLFIRVTMEQLQYKRRRDEY